MKDIDFNTIVQARKLVNKNSDLLEKPCFSANVKNILLQPLLFACVPFATIYFAFKDYDSIPAKILGSLSGLLLSVPFFAVTCTLKFLYGIISLPFALVEVVSSIFSKERREKLKLIRNVKHLNKLVKGIEGDNELTSFFVELLYKEKDIVTLMQKIDELNLKFGREELKEPYFVETFKNESEGKRYVPDGLYPKYTNTKNKDTDYTY